MVVVTQPFYCQLCRIFSSGITEAQSHLYGADHNDKYKVDKFFHFLLTI